MARVLELDFPPLESLPPYRTKDFRSVLHDAVIEIVGSHKASHAWLQSRGGDNLRAQFFNCGKLLAHDEIEARALIDSLQGEYI